MAWEPNKPLVIEEIEVAPPQANELRIKVRDFRFQGLDMFMHRDVLLYMWVGSIKGLRKMMKDFVEKVQVERSTVKVENGFLEKNSALLSLISNT